MHHSGLQWCPCGYLMPSAAALSNSLLPRPETRATDVLRNPHPIHLMNILLLGSGGREHALAWKIAASPLLTKLWCAPGNAGIAQEAECVALDIADHAAVIAFCKAQAIDLVVVGPETPLVAGIVDDLRAAGIKAFGPSKLGGPARRLQGLHQGPVQRQQYSDRGL